MKTVDDLRMELEEAFFLKSFIDWKWEDDRTMLINCYGTETEETLKRVCKYISDSFIIDYVVCNVIKCTITVHLR
jgi:hypothetical protein